MSKGNGLGCCFFFFLDSIVKKEIRGKSMHYINHMKNIQYTIKRLNTSKTSTQQKAFFLKIWLLWFWSMIWNDGSQDSSSRECKQSIWPLLNVKCAALRWDRICLLKANWNDDQAPVNNCPDQLLRCWGTGHPLTCCVSHANDLFYWIMCLSKHSMDNYLTNCPSLQYFLQSR